MIDWRLRNIVAAFPVPSPKVWLWLAMFPVVPLLQDSTVLCFISSVPFIQPKRQVPSVLLLSGEWNRQYHTHSGGNRTRKFGGCQEVSEFLEEISGFRGILSKKTIVWRFCLVVKCHFSYFCLVAVFMYSVVTVQSTISTLPHFLHKQTA